MTAVASRWWEQSACARPGIDPVIFDIGSDTHFQNREALSVCHQCDVIYDCLAEVRRLPMSEREHGVIRAGRVWPVAKHRFSKPPTVSMRRRVSLVRRTPKPVRVRVVDQVDETQLRVLRALERQRRKAQKALDYLRVTAGEHPQHFAEALDLAERAVVLAQDRIDWHTKH